MSNSKDYLTELAPEALRWNCSPDLFDFETTADIECTEQIAGQDTAQEALEFGILCHAPGQNVYVRGSRGTGRIRMVRLLLKQLEPTTDKKRDYCYVHNFSRADRPRLITLAPGTAHDFRRDVEQLARFIQDGLIKAVTGEPFASRRAAIQEETQKKVKQISDPLEKDLAAAGMALVSLQQGPVPQTMIFPLLNGEPVAPDKLRAAVAQKEAPAEQWENYESQVGQFQKRMQEISREVGEVYQAGNAALKELNQNAAKHLTSEYTEKIVAKYPFECVHEFINEVVENAVEFQLRPREEDDVDLVEVYGVNVVLTHEDPVVSPVVEEVAPTMMNLLGTVEADMGPGGMAISDYRGIRAGAILNADQGYLVLDVNDLLSEPGAWRALMRTVRTGQLEIVPPEAGWMRQTVVTQPEPIPVSVRVILIGDARTYYMLDRNDPDFRDLFKVLADFDSEIMRDDLGVRQYGSVIARLVRDESLSHFHREAIAALAEHGARIASRSEKLTARFGRIADIAREAAFLAKGEIVQGDHVWDAIRRTKARASLPSRKFQSMVERGTILVETSGSVVGQINGLAVMHSGPLTYGFPARITGTIGAGRAGLINIEGRAQMSGAIHTKGFHILGGLLRYMLDLDHPLAFSASLAFEQSYGGIDGDSASGAEIVCLLSAMTGVPIKQSMAMTGAIDQHGHLEAIGGVNEKIEGFFDACNHFGLTGEQGVVVPLANAADLMLRRDVVEASREGKFHVYATDSIFDAIQLMTGVPAGHRNGDGQYPEGSILFQAVNKAKEFWLRTLAAPNRLSTVEVTGPSDEQQLILPTDSDRR